MDLRSQREAFVKALEEQKEWRASRIAALKTDRRGYQEALETQLAAWRERLDEFSDFSAGDADLSGRAEGLHREVEIAWQHAREKLDALERSLEPDWPDQAAAVDDAVDALLWKIHEWSSAVAPDSDELRLERVEGEVPSGLLEDEPPAAGHDEVPL
jgi:hypothetical protein